MIDLKFMKGLILMRHVHQKSVIFVTIGIFVIKGLSFNRLSVIDVML